MTVKLSPAIQISLSTAEDSANYFTGEIPRVHQADLSRAMPSGTYRIVDDQLFQLIEARRVTFPSESEVDSPKKDVAQVPARVHHSTMTERPTTPVRLYDREAAGKREAHYPPFEPSQDIIDQIDSLVSDTQRRYYDTASDETFTECLICGGWEEHTNDCPWPAMDKWLRMEGD